MCYTSILEELEIIPGYVEIFMMVKKKSMFGQ